MVKPIRIIIEGGEAFERIVLANEVQALLESNGIAVQANDPGRVVHDEDEHHTHLQYIANTHSRVTPIALEVER